jgi:phosphatidylglycerophosphate synthase
MSRVRWIALAAGVVIFAITLSYVDVTDAAATIRRLGFALPAALLFSALWHLARTWAWHWCFSAPRTVSFGLLARVRLAAEAFSYLTLRGIAGEPLKVVLLEGLVDTRKAAAAVALDRLAFVVGTTLIVGAGSVMAMTTLPLTDGWFRVFRAFAIVAGVTGLLTAIAISGRGTYFETLIGRIDRRYGSRLSSGRVARFMCAVERLMLDLVRHQPKRLAVLAVSTVISYVCMVLEAWVVLHAVDARVSLTGAFAVETFSRVASFASSIIPANLGALEASSVAAAAAIGTAGGAALAVARRLRGLFWAGLGLALYPRRPAPPMPAGQTGSARERMSRMLLYLPHAGDVTVPPSARLAGMPIAERVVRAAQRAGYSRVVVLSSALEGTRLPTLPGVQFVQTLKQWHDAIEHPSSRALTVIGAGTVVSPALLEAAAAVVPPADDVCDVPAGTGWPETGLLRAGAAIARDCTRLERELAARRARALPLPSGEDVSRGRARLALRIRTSDDLAAAERIIRRSSYKDTDGAVARFNRRISLPISVALMRSPLTANQLSLILVAIGVYAAWLFSLGHYWTGVLAAALSVAASVLDGCDGEIARLKYQESALGCWIETIGDYMYYVAIFIGLTVGAVRQTGAAAFHWIGGLALAGTLTTLILLIFLRSRITSGRPERLHAIARDRFQAEPSWWTRLLWRGSFLATRAAMPYGILALALVNALPAALVMIAVAANVYWVALTIKLRALTINNPQSTILTQQSTIPSQQSTIPTQQSTITSQQSAIHNQQLS